MFPRIRGRMRRSFPPQEFTICFPAAITIAHLCCCRGVSMKTHHSGGKGRMARRFYSGIPVLSYRRVRCLVVHRSCRQDTTRCRCSFSNMNIPATTPMEPSSLAPKGKIPICSRSRQNWCSSGTASTHIRDCNIQDSTRLSQTSHSSSVMICQQLAAMAAHTGKMV